jgi:hypothetical protein
MQKYKLTVDQVGALEYPARISWPAYKLYRVKYVGSFDLA